MAIVAVRFVLGTASWFLPRLTARLMLIDPDQNLAAAPLLRFFGVRDVYLGATVLGAEPAKRDRLLSIGIVVDLFDVAACVIGGLTGQISKRAALLSSIAGTLGAALGAAAIGEGPLAHKD
jgi:hypothetical protein